MKRLLVVLPLLLLAGSKAEASVYADLYTKTVYAKNDGLPSLVITDGTTVVKTTLQGAMSPPGTQGRAPSELVTAQMNEDGFKYYSNKFKLLSPKKEPELPYLKLREQLKQQNEAKARKLARCEFNKQNMTHKAGGGWSGGYTLYSTGEIVFIDAFGRCEYGRKLGEFNNPCCYAWVIEDDQLVFYTNMGGSKVYRHPRQRIAPDVTSKYE